MTEKQTADKKETSMQEGLEKMGMGRLRFFVAFLAYCLYLALFIGTFDNIYNTSGNLGRSFVDALHYFPLGFLVACRLANAGCPWPFFIGLAGSVIFWKFLWVALRRIKYDDPEPAVITLAIFALTLIVLLVIPPKVKPESTPDKKPPENNGQ